ncbi:uncharacterized protein BDZ83DRAFT_160430 [Colletotrichum acutatum]|uniref:Uncharacterized protein n=1 Tax=Glomerella acutata TaxID=27357 RepID=A0AAD8XQC6_GLOAC|nr:uncharacterized protein BDZ83DRAFT_160430 [Colletotrichum acutatum]KAK1731466.1 hypothetical protein BDZ83DRAFT_160430 [Colletotrichum acutatum]
MAYPIRISVLNRRKEQPLHPASSRLIPAWWNHRYPHVPRTQSGEGGAAWTRKWTDPDRGGRQARYVLDSPTFSIGFRWRRFPLKIARRRSPISSSSATYTPTYLTFTTTPHIKSHSSTHHSDQTHIPYTSTHIHTHPPTYLYPDRLLGPASYHSFTSRSRHYRLITDSQPPLSSPPPLLSAALPYLSTPYILYTPHPAGATNRRAPPPPPTVSPSSSAGIHTSLPPSHDAHLLTRPGSLKPNPVHLIQLT